MSEFTLEEERARINQMLEETRKFTSEQHKLTAEAGKLAAEQNKLGAEQNKLFAQAMKFERDRWWTPALPIAAALGAMLGIATFISRLLGH